MSARTLAVLFGFFVFLNPTFADAARRKYKKSDQVISRITIRGTDIFDFDSDAALEKFPYTWINTLHIKTKEKVVRRELLFKVGDKVDPFLLRETERNLRALSFIHSARVAQFPQRDGSVAIVVYVSDTWTTEPQINLSGINGVDTVEFGFKEKNLLGWGKTVGVFYENGENITQRSYSYTDPRLLGSRWQLNAQALNATDEENRKIKIQRPFYAADTKWSTFGYHEVGTAKVDEFENQQRVSSYNQRKEIDEIYSGLKVGPERELVNHIGLRWRNEHRSAQRTDKTEHSRGVPESEELETVFLDMDSSQNDFIELTRLEKMTRIEDVNLGAVMNLSPGLNPSISAHDENSTQLIASLEKKHLINDIHVLQEKISYSGRDTFGAAENERYLMNVKYYHRAVDWNTLVLNTKAEWGKNLDPDNQIKLGSTSGLRAYAEDSIVGTKSWLLNVEDRLFFMDELWNLFAVGAAVFYETGYVWPRGHPIAISDLKSEVGCGLRLGLTRSSNEVVLRFDVGYRMQESQGNSPGLVFTFGTGQAF